MIKKNHTYSRQMSLFDELVPSEVPSNNNSPLIYISFGSGSSGNSCYIGTRDAGIIIDAGVRIDFVEKTLLERGIGIESVKALLLTHDHADHVRFAYTLLRGRSHIRLYCTNRVLNAVLRHHNISKRIKDYHTPIYKEIPFKVAQFKLTAFEVPHDSEDSVGFFVESGNHKFAIATDLGEINPRTDWYMRQADYIMIEANYDDDMLRLGRYPEYLKSRIRSGHGHLDNKVTARFVSEIYRPGLKFIFLCHLSKDNNTPSKALEAVSNSLIDLGLVVGNGGENEKDLKADIQLVALPRFEASRTYVLRP